MLSIKKHATDSQIVRLVHALRLIDGLATSTLAFAVPLIIYATTRSAAWSGIAFLFEWLPRLTAIPTAGPLVDRYGSNVVFIITNACRATVIFAAVVGLSYYPHAWLLLVLLAIISGMCAEISFVAAEHMGMAITTRRNLHKVQSTQVAIDQSVLVLGPVIASSLLTVGTTVTLVCIIFLALSSTYLSYKASNSPPFSYSSPAEERSLSVTRGLKAGLSIVKTESSLKYAIISVGMYNTLMGLALSMTPAFVVERFHLNVTNVGTIWGVGAAISIITVLLTERVVRYTGVTIIGVLSAVIGCVAMIAIAFTRNYTEYILGLTVFISMDATYAIFIRTARIRLIPKEHYANTVGVIVLLLLAPYPIAGGLLAIVPFRYITGLVFVLAVLTLGTTVYGFIKIDRRRIDNSIG